MLYLAPPFHIIEGVTIFKDHEDPRQFYFMPLMPHLTTLDDRDAGVRVPQIQLIKYRGKAGKGGFLNFDVNLGIDEDKLDLIRNKIKSLQGLSDTPLLSPVPLTDGTVKLMLLGKESKPIPAPSGNGSGSSVNSEPEPQTGEGPQFVVRIDHHAKPSLYGDNQASFSVQLDQAGVTIVEKALQGEISPIGIVYSLDYLALRPAYSVRVKADWERVQHHLHESFGVGFLFFSAQIDKVIDELIENRVIVIEIDNYIPPGEDASDIIGRLDQAVNEVKEMVFDTFFEPSIDPMKDEKEEDGWDKFTGTVERLFLLHATGGWSALGGSGFTMKNVDWTRIDKKRLDINMSERTTVKRSIHPQAHLQGLFRILREGNVNLDRFIVEVDLDDEWFEERRVKVISRANFQTDNIESVNVRLKYNNKTQNVLLDAAAPQATVSWNSAKSADGYLRGVEATYKVAFKNIDSAERPITLSSPKEIIEIENYEVRPHELYSLIQVPIIALDFPWSLYSFVEVRTRYSDSKNHIKIEDTFILDSKTPEKRWNLFTLDPKLNTFEYKLIYRSPDHRDIEMPWVSTDAEQIIIRDPYPRKRKLEVVPAVNWKEISLVYVDVTYTDPANNTREEFSLKFSPAEAQSKSVEVKKLVNPEHRFLAYKATILYQDGRVLESPLSETRADRIFVTSQMKGHKIVTVKPEAVSFAGKKLKEIEISLKYEDAKAGLTFADVFTFQSHEDHPGYFEFDFVDKAKATFEYQTKYIYKNGLQKTSTKKLSNENTLNVSVI